MHYMNEGFWNAQVLCLLSSHLPEAPTTQNDPLSQKTLLPVHTRVSTKAYILKRLGSSQHLERQCTCDKSQGVA